MKNDFSDKVSLEDIEKFTSIHGQRGAKTLSLLGKKSQFQQAISDPIGQSLMSDLMIQMELLLNKIIEDKASDTERADYRAYKRIFERWSSKISQYNELKDKVKTRSRK